MKLWTTHLEREGICLKQSGAGRMAQWVKVTSAHPEDPSLMPRIHMEEGESQLTSPGLHPSTLAWTCFYPITYLLNYKK